MSAPNDLKRAAEIVRLNGEAFKNPENIALASRLEAMSAPDNAALIAEIDARLESNRRYFPVYDDEGLLRRCRTALEQQTHEG